MIRSNSQSARFSTRPSPNTESAINNRLPTLAPAIPYSDLRTPCWPPLARHDSITGPGLADDLEVSGTVAAEIYLRSSRSHTDVMARLCDVAPDGRSVNVCDGILRLTAQDEPDAAGVRTARVELWPTAYRFRRGHRLRLQVSSGAHPRYDRNLGTGDQLGTEAVVADQEILHDPARPSAILLPVLAGG